ncbi:hypothetical protein AB0J21_28900 [Streptomyces sp. NPDC049954]|uniref:hypothetical protein n=1 Tax=Streptomyces sp. NPDC049954 TaxID=3155779 RepID=UPI003440CBDA
MNAISAQASGFAATVRGGDGSGGWVLAAERTTGREECAEWLRNSALRLAVRLDPGPAVTWAPPSLVRPVFGSGPDAPATLRAWAEDQDRQRATFELLAWEIPFTLRFPDRGGAWYELAAAPIPSPTYPSSGPTP